MKKIVILGSKGFVGKNLVEEIIIRKTYDLLQISRDNVDFLSKDFVDLLQKEISDGNIVINCFAVAPCKNLDQLNINLKLISNFLKGLDNKKNLNLINISSDAVYPDINGKLNEEVQPMPNSIHGIMHQLREDLISLNFENFLNIRPTLIFGYGDPHGGYGPNQFIQKILNNQEIDLFGKGEELRDHIYIKDLVNLIILSIEKNIKGNLNLVTGQVTSFFDIAKSVVNISNKNIKINFSERKGLMPHNGYRAFDKSKISSEFSSYKFYELTDALKETYNKYIDE